MASPRPARAKPPLPPGAERRRFERFELLAHVELRRADEVSLLPVVNISAGGVLVRIDNGELADLAVDEQVNVFLDVSDLPEPIAVTMEASVVRVSPNVSVALMWSSTSSDALAQLAKLLDYIRTRE